ncbi:MAG: glucose 1-dehydrogenase [Alphaproteobacteria bacterium]|nr:glucose 1-dehydrogenase [Alphaproteobacteria bacterium]
MGRVEGKVALVTGAASGIGRACAQALAREGAQLVLTDVQDDKGEIVAAEIERTGGKALYLRQDVTSEVGWAGIISTIARRFGRLDILVNNAGIAVGGKVTEVSLDDWRRQQAANVESVFLGVKHALPLMRQSGDGGSIINISSVAGLKGAANLSPYCASKGAVRLFSKAIALQCAQEKDGVRCNSVHPGIIDTPIWTGFPGLPLKGNAPDLDAMTAAGVPLGRPGAPEDIANGVLWLASDESRYVTGSELLIDGGYMTR